MLALGVDIGGSGIKAAIVDTANANMVSERARVKTPANLEPMELVSIIKHLMDMLAWRKGPVGIGFPGVIREQVIHTAANLNDSLIGLNLADSLNGSVDGPVRILNDADAAGFAEMRFGAGLPCARSGTVLLLTVGTGIGTVLFSDGVLVPNLELGHVQFNGVNAESYVSERARKAQNLSWKQWAKRFNAYLNYLEFLLQPDFLIIGGGGVKKPEKFLEFINISTPWAFAKYGNRAGIIGAATAAAQA